MATKTVSLLSAEERQQCAVNLLTRTTVTQQNYYSLYISNPQVNCICKIWNCIVYCLFSWLGWFLGKAGDVNDKVCMKQETPLIQNYNQAKKALLEAINEKKTGSYSEAEENYLKALNARVEQIGTFSYSAQATQRGCKIEKDGLFEAANADLTKALKEGIHLPLSLRSLQVSQTSSGNPSTPSKKDIENERQRVKGELINSFCKGRPEEQLNEEAAEKYFATIEAEINASPNYLDISRKELEKIRFETCANHWSTDKLLKLFLLFAKRFDVPKKDSDFLTRFDLLIRPHYAHELEFFTGQKARGPLAILKSYSQSLQTIYDAQNPKMDSVNSDVYIKKQLCSFLSEIHKKYGEGYTHHYTKYSNNEIENEKSFRHNRQICALAKHLPCFSPTATKEEQALGLQFIETVLIFTPEEPNASSTSPSSTPSDLPPTTPQVPPTDSASD